MDDGTHVITQAALHAKFRRAVWRVRDAEKALTKAMIRAFPKGANVTYKHGNYARYGEVLDHGSCSLRIRSPYRKFLWIDASRVEEQA